MKVLKEQTLTEDFSPSMPKWLRERLLNNAMYDQAVSNKLNGSGWGKAHIKNRYETRGYEFDDFAAVHQGGRNRSDSLYREMLNAGIDLSNANFISAEIPTGPKNPLLREPNIPILLLEVKNYHGDISRQVYVKGFNDDEEFYGINLSDDKFYGKQFRYIPMKELLAIATDFCYLDGSDKSNYMSDKKAKRTEIKQDYLNNPNADSYMKYKPAVATSRDLSGNLLKDPARNNYYGVETRVDSVYGDKKTVGRYSDKRTFDKSGYISDPHKFDAELKKLRRGTLADKIASYGEQINEYKEALKDMFDEVDIEDASGSALDTIRDFTSTLSSASYYYRDLTNTLSRILDIPDEEDKNRQLDNFQDNYEFREIKRYLDSLEKQSQNYRRTIFDW